MKFLRFGPALSGVLLALSVLASAQAQTVAYDHGSSATATGAGAAGTPSLAFNVTAGQNRIVFITATFERDHCTTNTTETSATCTDETAANSNFAAPGFVASGGADMQIQFTLTGPGGSLTVTNPLAPPNGDLRFAFSGALVAGSTADRQAYSRESYFVALYESQLRTLLGGTTGSITITLPNVDAPNRAGDEALLSAVQFNNTNQRTDGGAGTGIVRSLISNARIDCNSNTQYTPSVDAPGNWSACTTAYDAGQAPVNAGDGVLLFGFNGYARTAPLDFQAVAGFTEMMSPAVINTDPSTTGTAGAHFLASTESDGFSTSFQFANGTPSGAIEMQSQNDSLTAAADTSGGFFAGFTLTRATLDLAITKTDGVPRYTPGQPLTYTVTVTNNSTLNYADGALFTDPAVSGLTVNSVTCGSATSGAVCPSSPTAADMQGAGIVIPTLPPGGSVTFTVGATPDASRTGNLTNTASIAAPTGYTDSNTANNSASDTDTPNGSIIIVKDAVPNDAQDFAFTTSGTGLSAFSLDDDADATLPNTRTFTGLAPGSYSVTEGALTGWDLTGLVCIDPDNGTTVNLGTRVATIDVDTGESITCTYTNTKRGSITIVKDAVPNDAQDFAFTTTGTGLSGFSLDDDSDATLSNTRIFTGLTAGSYSVTETALAGWSLTNLLCADPDNGSTVSLGSRVATIDLDAGESIACTYTNTSTTANLAITKASTPNGPLTTGQTISYTVTATNNGPGAADGARLYDPAVAGLNCTTIASCTSAGGAVCPGSPTVSGLQTSPGLAIPTFPNGGSVTLVLSCQVTATGQ